MDRAVIQILIVKQMPNICRWIMKYDCEQRRINQDYELKELKERQKVQLRQKAAKKGLDPEAFTGKYPPRIRMFSKYERRTDTRTYADRKGLYEGGWEVVRVEMLGKFYTTCHGGIPVGLIPNQVIFRHVTSSVPKTKFESAKATTSHPLMIFLTHAFVRDVFFWYKKKPH